MDRFSPEFIRKRQQGLERFLHRILLHPRLSQHAALKSFLTQPVLGIEENMSIPKMESPTGMAAMMEQLSDVVVNVFSKTRPIDERFIIMKKTVSIIEGHMDKLTALHGQLSSAYMGLSESFMSSGNALSQVSSNFGQLERIVSAEVGDGRLENSTPLRTIIGDYGQLLEERSANIATMGTGVDMKVYLPLSEFAQYCRGAKHALRLRDQRQSEWQDIEEHLNAAREECSELSGDTAKSSSSEVTAGERLRASKSAVVSYLSERIDSFRGIDPITARTERMKKLENRIKELIEALEAGQEQSKTIDVTVEKEYHGFLVILAREFREQLIPGQCAAWINLHQQDLSLWSAFARDTLGISTEEESTVQA